MNYDEMTDFEINKAVAEVHLGYIELGYRFVNTGIDSSKHYGEEYPVRRITRNVKYWEPFEPCSDPSDAWYIIVENKIDIQFRSTIKAGPMAQLSGDSEIYYVDENPLRAAMIVYLMSKEGENDSV